MSTPGIRALERLRQEAHELWTRLSYMQDFFHTVYTHKRCCKINSE